MLTKILFASGLLAIACSASAGLKSSPGQYEIVKEPLKTGPRTVHLIYARPAQPRHPEYLVVFATGDGGWRSVSSEVFTHLAAPAMTVLPIAISTAVRS